MSKHTDSASDNAAQTPHPAATSAAAPATDAASVSKTPIIVALVLAVLLVAGVLVGTKMMYDRAEDQPVHVATIDAPEADSKQCADFTAALPDSFARLERATLADPAPAGAAVWHDIHNHTITVRCGVQRPLQFTAYHAPLVTGGGTQWLEVRDTTAGVNLVTWYAVGTSPVVALSLANEYAEQTPDFAALSDAIAALDATAQPPQELPIANLAVADTTQCQDFLNALPQAFGTQPRYERTDADLEQSAVYTAAGYESIVVRCGVPFPDFYEPGLQVQQINEVAWLEDTTLGNGTTASTWYALGHEQVVAASMPQASGNAALTTFSNAVAETIPAE